jgi:hypothetical protein
MALRGPASDCLIENILQLAAQGGQLLDPVTCQPYPETPLIDEFNVMSKFTPRLPLAWSTGKQARCWLSRRAAWNIYRLA